MKLTKATIGNLVLPAGKSDMIVFDDELRGFGIRIRAGGKRSWIVQYRTGAKQRRLTLAAVNLLDPETARKEARNTLAAATLGHDPQAEKAAARARAAITLAAVVESYLDGKQSSLRPRSFAETARYLRKSWKSLHGLAVYKITRSDVAARLTEIKNGNGPVAATRARAALSALFAWAVREGICESNPVISTNRPAEPKSRDRVLTDAELAAIWSVSQDDDYGRIVRLLMLTGQRRNEVGAMAWSEIDLERRSWSIPADRNKNKRSHKIALTSFALSMIQTVARRADTDRLFGIGKMGFQGWSRGKRMLDARIAAFGPMESWCVHDLRRTAATRMAELGVLPHVIEALLNHISGHKAGVAGVYNRSTYEREGRAALALWADHIRSIVEGSDNKIIPLRQRA